MNETELVRRFLDGDREAFEEIINLYQAQALRSAYLISGNYADSEDIVQETFVACFLNRTQMRRRSEAGFIGRSPGMPGGSARKNGANSRPKKSIRRTNPGRKDFWIRWSCGRRSGRSSRRSAGCPSNSGP